MADVILRVPIEVAETDWLRVSRAAARLVFRGDAEVCLAAGTAFGAPLAARTGRAVAYGARVSLALGPDEHLFILPESDAPVLQSRLSGVLAGRPHSLVDVSHRQVGLQLSGERADWLLAAGCPLPLAAEVFPLNACARTVFGKAEIVLWRNAPDAFYVEVARSYCQYVAGLLHEIAREFPDGRGDT